MLHYYLFPLAEKFIIFNVFRYITFRSFGAALTSLLISLLIGPTVIHKLKSLQMGQVVRDDGPATHLKKSGTPTMGGVLILFAVIVSTVLWVELNNPSVWIVIFVTFGYGILGWVDDYRKVVLKNTKGVSAKQKLLFQMIIAGIAVWLLMQYTTATTELHFPFFKNFTINLGWFYYVLSILVIVGASNAVNLTDGLDGLAIGTVTISIATFMILSYLAGHIKFASYLEIPYVAGTGELAVFCAAMAAAGLGFLWFNAHPAEVFMGDVGSLALGGALGAVAVITKHELLLLIVGGIFVVEALSVMIQVFVYKTKKKRVFRMAPIHHHFELKGWHESKVIIRFWIIAVILALIALSTLKLR